MYFLFFILIFLFFSVNCFIFNKPYSFNAKSDIKMSLHGLDLGVITLGTGLLIDSTVSKNSLEILKVNNTSLYNEGMRRSIKNLIFLGPFYYFIVEKYLITDLSTNFNFQQTLGLVTIHSIGYYLSHKSMHQNDFFKKYHYFHHQFNETLIPSIGNAVSETEFTLAYMSPFVVGSLLIHPNINSFNLAIYIVSYFNLIIHCQELQDLKWNKYLVSPKTHLNHHQSKNKYSAYSAPTFNLENIGRKVRDIFENILKKK